jgi:hypothetical protein
MHVSRRVADRVCIDFAERAAAVIALLSSVEVGRGTPDGGERFCAAILAVATGDIDRLRQSVQLAQQDWRDVLVAGGFENDDWRDVVDGFLA